MKAKSSLFLVCIAPTVLFASAADKLSPLPSGAIALNGGLERDIRKSIDGWILGDVPYHDFSRLFREGRPKFATGEMWGKFVRSGCMFYRYSHDEAIKERKAELYS